MEYLIENESDDETKTSETIKPKTPTTVDKTLQNLVQCNIHEHNDDQLSYYNGQQQPKHRVERILISLQSRVHWDMSIYASYNMIKIVLRGLNMRTQKHVECKLKLGIYNSLKNPFYCINFESIYTIGCQSVALARTGLQAVHFNYGKELLDYNVF